jgi:hypothetical protein
MADIDPQPTRQTAAERLAEALGWDEVPAMTDDQRAEFERRNDEADRAAREFYPRRAA